MATPTIRHYADGVTSVQRSPVVYTGLRFYQRSDVLYQLTIHFCDRFLPKFGDRTVDQMKQAARSTKQNIAEGSSDGQTSFESELKLLGVARGSNIELLEDYQDYLKSKQQIEWKGTNPRFETLHDFCNLYSVITNRSLLRWMTSNWQIWQSASAIKWIVPCVSILRRKTVSLPRKAVSANE